MDALVATKLFIYYKSLERVFEIQYKTSCHAVEGMKNNSKTAKPGFSTKHNNGSSWEA